MTKRKPKKTPARPRPAKIDWLIGRVLDSARDVLLKAVPNVSMTEERRQRVCILVVDGQDHVAHAFYEDCLRAGMHAPALKPYVVTTSTQPFEPTIKTAAFHYDIAGHEEPPLGAGEVRAIVATLGTLTLVRLGPDATPLHASVSHRPLRPDVLLVATACWRNDRPEGFLVRAVFQTRKQGERFLEHFSAQCSEIAASHPRPEAIVDQLRRFKPVYGRNEPPFDVQVRTYAQVGWLETSGLLPDDSFNGLVFEYGCAMDLEQSSELVRTLGGPLDDLN